MNSAASTSRRQARQLWPGGVRRQAAALRAGLAICLAGLCGASLQAAEPEPVLVGLWEVRMLAFFDPDPQPGATEWPGLPGKARARTYRVCLDALRARAPMSLPRLSPDAQRSSDKMSVLVHEGRSAAPHNEPALESIYRRLSAREFEGSHSLVSETQSMTLQYSSVFLQVDCEGIRPATMSRFGEP
jgi:hypothetical protein